MTDEQPIDHDDVSPAPENDVSMSFFEHLGELRGRLIRAAIGLVGGCIVALFFVRDLQDLLLRPLHRAWLEVGLEGQPTLQNVAVLDHFLTHLRIGITAGLFVAAPVVFYQVWLFVSPGLYRREKRFVIPFVSMSAIMFALGAVFCYLMVLPYATEWFLRYAQAPDVESSVQIISQYRFPDYIKYTTKLLVGFGLMFEFPLLVLFLALAGVLTHRTLLRHWKISVLLLFVASALLTPPDPITLMLMATPMVALYFASVVVAYVVARPRPEADEAGPESGGGPSGA